MILAGSEVAGTTVPQLTDERPLAFVDYAVPHGLGLFRLAKAGGDAAQRTIRTDMAAPAHSVIARHRPAFRLLPAAKIAVNITRGADHRFPLFLCRARLSCREGEGV